MCERQEGSRIEDTAYRLYSTPRVELPIADGEGFKYALCFFRLQEELHHQSKEARKRSRRCGVRAPSLNRGAWRKAQVEFDIPFSITAADRQWVRLLHPDGSSSRPHRRGRGIRGRYRGILKVQEYLDSIKARQRIDRWAGLGVGRCASCAVRCFELGCRCPVSCLSVRVYAVDWGGGLRCAGVDVGG
ncbi:hypothetical protein BDN71DRAFT_1212063 [Pleurotus eryngii]|uniref:Uncharacterized protein n=1 Tax=Pleurotus eryngii TaxID=5323 RepID=A0A9P5ZU69_PLEER|nr:hypothetical protein BDN71DRAFT_1212063 [Pleurotus eryngii]